MLQQLSVKNYALIDSLELSPGQGFSVITGETGAGKSIILGALHLILGQRADLKVLRNPQRKCVVEGSFALPAKRYQSFFEHHDLDFENPCIIRREISPSGKSRAFINDTPVRLNILHALSQQVIDVHSQHDTLLLKDNAFQLQLLDSFAQNEKLRQVYHQKYKAWQELLRERDTFHANVEREVGDTDYLEFLYRELKDAELEPGEQENLEDELQLLEHAEEITSRLATALRLIEDEQGQGITPSLRSLFQEVEQLAQYQSDFSDLSDRIQSLRIELDDIAQDLNGRTDQIDNDPGRQEKLDARLSQLLHLQKKHQVGSVEDLIEKRLTLEQKLELLTNHEERKAALNAAVDKAEKELNEAADALSQSRHEVAPGIAGEINQMLHELKMPEAHFEIELPRLVEYTAHGRDKVLFQFTANEGSASQPLHKVASGGELSRVMLSLKAIMARKNQLPSIIFDEIDSGVSGETAGKVGQILRDMGQQMQVMAITHLPQIASLGGVHFKVLKTGDQGQKATQILELNGEERLSELARLLSGEKITQAALDNARNLLAHA